MFQHFVCGELLYFAFTALFNCGFVGYMKIKLKAWNIFSSMEIDVDMPTACSKDTDIKEVKYFILCFLVFLFESFSLLCTLFLFMFVLFLTTLSKRNRLDLPGLTLRCQLWQHLAIS